MKRWRLLPAALALAAAGAGAPASATTVIGPAVTALSAGRYVNPRLSGTVPVSYSFSSQWTTATLTVQDAGGNTVRVLDTRSASEGSVQTSWDGRDAAGNAVPDGTYKIVARVAGYDYRSTLGGFGAGDGRLSAPTAVGVAPDGSVWVADTGNNRLEHFAPDGTYLSQISAGSTSFSNPLTIHFDSDGNLLVTNASSHGYRIKPSDGSLIGQIPPANADGSDITPPYRGEVWDLQQLRNGNFVMGAYTGYAPNQSCCGYWSLFEYSPDFRTYVRGYGSGPREQALTQLDDSTIAAASGYDGYTSDYAPAGYLISNNGSFCTTSCRWLGRAYGLTHGDGNDSIVSMIDYQQIAELPEGGNTPTWVLGTTAGGSANGQFDGPRGVARNGDDLYVTDELNHRVEHYVRAAAVSADVVVDTKGPATSNVTLTPAVGGGSILSAAADDTGTGGSQIAAAEYFADSTGPDGSGHPLAAQDGRFDAPTETVFGYLSPPTGEHTIFVHAQDAAGNWGGFVSIHVLSTPAGVIALPF